MTKYAIYDDGGIFLFDLHADSKDEAIAQAKRYNPKAYQAKVLVEEDERD